MNRLHQTERPPELYEHTDYPHEHFAVWYCDKNAASISPEEISSAQYQIVSTLPRPEGREDPRRGLDSSQDVHDYIRRGGAYHVVGLNGDNPEGERTSYMGFMKHQPGSAKTGHGITHNRLFPELRLKLTNRKAMIIDQLAISLPQSEQNESAAETSKLLEVAPDIGLLLCREAGRYHMQHHDFKKEDEVRLVDRLAPDDFQFETSLKLLGLTSLNDEQREIERQREEWETRIMSTSGDTPHTPNRLTNTDSNSQLKRIMLFADIFNLVNVAEMQIRERVIRVEH